MLLDIVYATHQCGRLYKDPRAPYGVAVKNLVKYLAAARKGGLILDPKKIEFWGFMRISVSAETGIRQQLTKTSASQNHVQDTQLCMRADQ